MQRQIASLANRALEPRTGLFSLNSGVQDHDGRLRHHQLDQGVQVDSRCRSMSKAVPMQAPRQTHGPFVLTAGVEKQSRHCVSHGSVPLDEQTTDGHMEWFRQRWRFI
jgi:hypothetical protein